MIRRFGSRSSSRSRRARGQALVEFAFVAPIFLLLLFAIIDFGRYVYYVQILNNAAREGTRYAIVHGSNSFTPAGPSPNDPKVDAVVRNYAIGVIGNAAVLDIDSVWGEPAIPPNPPPPPTNNRGSRVKVTVSYSFNSMIPIVPIPPITINGESTLVINN
jgi:Flp pilus assembly protein TadG